MHYPDSYHDTCKLFNPDVHGCTLLAVFNIHGCIARCDPHDYKKQIAVFRANGIEVPNLKDENQYQKWIPRAGIAPWYKQIWNFIRSMVRNAKHGFKLSGGREVEQKLIICSRCSHLTDHLNRWVRLMLDMLIVPLLLLGFDVTTFKRCRKCGCGVSLKVRLEYEHCPIGKW